jgi:hypothetical protein
VSIDPMRGQTEHLNPRFVHDEVCDSVMAIEGFPNLSVGDGLIPLAQPRMLAEKLSFGEDAPHDVKRSPHRLESPPYFRHDSIASAAFSAVCVRPAAASSRPNVALGGEPLGLLYERERRFAILAFEFLDRLAIFPPPRKHRHRYHGVFAPKHTLRRAVMALAIANVGFSARGGDRRAWGRR